MAKTIIIDEDVIKKGVLNEAIQFNQMPKQIRLSLLRGKTPLSNNSALPYADYLEHECIKRFNELSNTGQDLDTNLISKIANQCSRIEKPYRNNLEKLCVDEVINLFSVPSDDVDFVAKIVDSVNQSNTDVPFGPNEEFPPDLLDIDEVETLQFEVEKRCLQNAIVCGAALHYTRLILDSCFSRLDEIDTNLYSLYHQYLDTNEYLLYNNGLQQEQNHKYLAGISILTLGNEETKNSLKIEAINFPVLVYETIKGFLEMCTSHGLPDNSTIRKAVLSKSDYITAEPWYMRFGPFIWGYVENAITPEISDQKAYLIPYVLMKISKLRVDKYLRLMKETLAGTKRSKMVMRRVSERANLDYEKKGFEDRLTNYRSNASVIINDEQIKTAGF